MKKKCKKYAGKYVKNMQKMQNNMKNMLFQEYIIILVEICKICNKMCTKCKMFIPKKYAEYALPTLLPGGPSLWHLPARAGVPPQRSQSVSGTGCDGRGHAVPPVTAPGRSEWLARGLRVS